jgi:hypothetical protein
MRSLLMYKICRKADKTSRSAVASVNWPAQFKENVFHLLLVSMCVRQAPSPVQPLNIQSRRFVWCCLFVFSLQLILSFDVINCHADSRHNKLSCRQNLAAHSKFDEADQLHCDFRFIETSKKLVWSFHSERTQIRQTIISVCRKLFGARSTEIFLKKV